MLTYERPGVYYEVVDASGQAITGVRTDVAGFVGIATRGPIDLPLPIESWRQFEAHFGSFTGAGFLAYAVRGFFENGGRRCWVVRVASRDRHGGAAAASAVARRIPQPPGPAPDIWRICASSPGAWGDDLTVRLTRTHRAQTTGDVATSKPHYLTVASTSGFERGTLVRITQPPAAPVYRVVSDLDPAHRRLVWLHERAALRLPYDQLLPGLQASSPVLVESVELSASVWEARVPIALFENLALIPEHPRYAPLVLPARYGAPDLEPYADAPCHLVAGEVESTREWEAERTLPAAPAPIAVLELRPRFCAAPRPAQVTITEDDIPGTQTLTLRDGRDGHALLTADDFLGGDEAVDDPDLVKLQRRRGLRALGRVSEVAIVAIPDIHVRPVRTPEVAPVPPCIPDPCLPPPLEPPSAPLARRRTPELPPVFREDEIARVQADLVQQCETLRDRVALLEAPFASALDPALGIAGVRAWRARFESRYAALYHGWLRVVDPLRSPGRITRDIPPSGHVAGQYARTDIAIGVHKAPANAPLAWVQDVTAPINDAEHGLLNSSGINVIRPLAGRGIRILGARTVSSEPDWRFINVRRLVLMIMKAVDLSTQWAVFEPNDNATRAKVQLSLVSFLTELWQRGALAGDTIEASFQVRCDESNNPPADRANGRLTADLAIAPSQPFEFVVVRVSRAGNEFEFAETTRSARGSQ